MRKEGKEKRMIEYHNTVKYNICKGRRYKDMYRKLLKNGGMGGKGVRNRRS
jgi:hypothetical protein